MNKNYDEVKYDLFIVVSSEEVHWQGKICLRINLDNDSQREAFNTF